MKSVIGAIAAVTLTACSGQDTSMYGAFYCAPPGEAGSKILVLGGDGKYLEKLTTFQDMNATGSYTLEGDRVLFTDGTLNRSYGAGAIAKTETGWEIRLSNPDIVCTKQ